MVYVCLPVVIESWLLSAHLCVGWHSDWLIWRIKLGQCEWVAGQMLPTHSRIHFSRLWCLPRSPFGYAVWEANWILFWFCLKPVVWRLVLGPLGWLLAALDPGKGQWQSQGTLCLPPSTCWLPIRLSHWKILWWYRVAWCRFSVTVVFNRGSKCVRASSEATQQMAQSTLSLGTTYWVLTHLLCWHGISGSHQGEAYRVNQSLTDQDLSVMGGLCTSWGKWPLS